jgi:hypothetical protein
MQRSLFATLLTALSTIVTCGGLALVCAAPHTAKPASHPEGDWRILDPVTYENIAIFPVVSSSSQDTSSFLTLEEGLASGEVIVSERGAGGLVRNRGQLRPPATPQYDSGASVNQLVLINRSKRPLLLLAGELVSGGKQDRVIAKDRIVPPGADPLPLDVFCVENGRWTGSSLQFTTSKVIVHPSVREQAAVKQKQAEVWAAVSGGSTAAAPPSAPPSAQPRLSSNALADAISSEAPTQSYRKIYESTRVGGSVDTFVDQVQRRFARATSALKGEHVVGVIVAYGGEVAWSDIFASGDLFRQYWSKLLRSYAVEALARPTLRETASPDDAREFLRRPNGREVQETEAGVYRWREITQGPLALIELDALHPKTMTLHRLLLHRTS